MLATDVAVVGGGPAGAAAAITLARSGRQVMLFDKTVFPRDKCCGDGLTTGALRSLENLGLEPTALPSWQTIDDVWVRSPSGRVVRFPFPRGYGTFGAVVRRLELDHALIDLARAAGVAVHDGHGVSGASVDGERVILSVDGLGDVAAHYAIGADGMWSPLRKLLLGPDPMESSSTYLGEWHAFRQYFDNVGPKAAEQLWVWFEPDLLPGYAWSFPLPGGRANVGFGIRRSSGHTTAEMKQLWPALLERSHIADVLGPSARPEAPHKAWPIPARLGATEIAAGGGRVLFVGDAARATDPMTGEGIGQALTTGMAAAAAVVEAGAGDPHRAAEHYRAALKGMVTDERLALFLSDHAIAHRKGVRTAIRLAGATDWTRRNFARWLFEDYPRAVVATPSRWHRRVFTGPGAFG